jgi:predicted nucleotidyltransferase
MGHNPIRLKQQLDQLVEELKAYGAEKIILFGSAARGDADASSDVDLVIIKPTTMSFVERLGDVVRQCPSDLIADILVYTPEEFQRMQETQSPFIETVLRDGKTLYEKS